MAALTSIALPAAAYDAEIIYVTGQGFVRETTEWTPAQQKQQLTAGASVRTAKYGQIALLLSDNTQLRVNQETELRITEVQPTDTTLIELSQGNIWAQAKRLLRSVTAGIKTVRPVVKVTTPTATIGIRGTDWDVRTEPGGVTLLTVLSGEAELTNEVGSIRVAPNEQARSEPGKAPTKVLLTHARERIQWVTAYRPQPQRWVGERDASEPVVAGLVRAIDAGDYAVAVPQLEKLAGQSAAAARLLADLYISWGRASDAVTLLQGRDDPLALALLSHALLVTDQAERAGQVIADGLLRFPAQAELLIAQGDWARFEGRGTTARQAFSAAIAANPGNAAGWFGRGRVDVEREALTPARRDLLQALALAPLGAGYAGELGTLETYANNFADAEAHFHAALAQQAGDFNALTGLGIVKLKMGQPAEALQAFLKAGVLQPDFARAALWTGVAYWQLGRAQNALDTFARAARLDPNDPLPHFYTAMIHSDQLEPGAAVAAAQHAIALWPKLKSLNQISSDQKGSANLGATLERFGLAEWALAAAWQSYTPFWGASHLFLADRTHDTYGKNSALFQGFLADPLVFGADPQRNSLIARPAAILGGRAKAAVGAQKVSEVGGQLTGYRAEPLPFAWFVDVEGNHSNPDDIAWQSDLANITLGLGVKPSFDTGLFLFANRYRIDIDFTDLATGLKDAPARSEPTRIDLGFHHKLSPEAHFWLKTGYGDQDRRIVGRIPTPSSWQTAEMYAKNPPAQIGLDYRDTSREDDLQGKLSWLSGAHNAHVTLEWANGDSGWQQGLSTRSASGADYVASVNVTQQRRSWRLGLSDWITLDNALHLHLQAAYTDYQQDDWLHSFAYEGLRLTARPAVATRANLSRFSPRIGAVWQFAVAPAPTLGHGTLRAAWREWLQPAGAATLDRVDTAGLLLDTRSVQPGGLLKNGKLQLEWETARSQYTAYLESARIDNLSAGYYSGIAATLSELEKLRQKAPDNVAGEDLLEGTPHFGAGRIDSVGLTGNWILTPQTSSYARLILRDSENRRENPGADLPYLPRHTLALGASHFPGGGWTLGAQAVHRSQSYTDAQHNVVMSAGWGLDGHAAWRSPERNWRLTFVVKGLGREQPAPRSALAQVETWW